MASKRTHTPTLTHTPAVPRAVCTLSPASGNAAPTLLSPVGRCRLRTLRLRAATAVSCGDFSLVRPTMRRRAAAQVAAHKNADQQCKRQRQLRGRPPHRRRPGRTGLHRLGTFTCVCTRERVSHGLGGGCHLQRSCASVWRETETCSRFCC